MKSKWGEGGRKNDSWRSNWTIKKRMSLVLEKENIAGRGLEPCKF